MAQRDEVAITETLLRTVILVAGTFTFIVLLRVNSIAGWIDAHFLNLGMWQWLYNALNIQTAHGREQCMMIALVAICFCLTFGLEFLVLKIWSYIRLRRNS